MNNFKDSSFEEKECKEEKEIDKESYITIEKILCNHCGRTTGNGIRCKGMCVADNDY